MKKKNPDSAVIKVLREIISRVFFWEETDGMASPPQGLRVFLNRTKAREGLNLLHYGNQ